MSTSDKDAMLSPKMSHITRKDRASRSPSPSDEGTPFAFFSQGSIPNGRRIVVQRVVQRLQLHKDDGTSFFDLALRQTSLAVLRKRDAVAHEAKKRPMKDERSFPAAGIEPTVANNFTRTLDEQYDYLMHWTLPGQEDDVLPTYGESGDEGKYDSDTWEEMQNEQEDREEAMKPTNILSDDEVRGAIEGALLIMSERWRSTMLPREERRAFGLWTKSHRYRTVTQVIQRLQDEINTKVAPRLAVLKETIAKETWPNIGAIVSQCHSLEATVFRSLQLDWQISMLKLSTPPSKPPKKDRIQLKAPKSTKPKMFEDGQEVEELGSGDSDSSFVIDDSSGQIRSTSLGYSKPDIQLPQAARSEDFIPLEDQEDRPSPGSMTDSRPFFEEISEESELLEQPDEPVPNHGSPPDIARSSGRLTPARPAPSDPSSPLILERPHAFRPDPIDLTDSPPRGTQNMPIALHSSPPFAAASRLRSQAGKQRSPHHLSEDRSSSLDSEDQEFCPYAKPKQSGAKGKPVIAKRPRSEEIEEIDLDSDTPARKKRLSFVNRRSVYISDKGHDDLLKAALDGVTAVRREELILMLLNKPRTKFSEHLREHYEAKMLGSSGRRAVLPSPTQELKERVAALGRFYKVWILGLSIAQPASQIQLRQLVDSIDSRCPSFVNKIEEYLVPHSVSAISAPTTAKKSHYVSKARREERAREEAAKLQQAQNRRAADRDQMAQQDKAFLALDEVRRRKQEERRLVLERKSGHKIETHFPEPASIAINATQPLIYLDRRISRRVMLHQIKGIRFLFRELISRGGQYQGCLLAHTMGLGKTMQVVACLLTIVQALKVADNWKLFPDDLKKMEFFMKNGINTSRKIRILIITPPVLINNWTDELLIWCPQPISSSLGELRAIQEHPPRERYQMIAAWNKEGGVLLISNQKFTSIVMPNQKPSGNSSYWDESHGEREIARRHLIEGAQIAIIDEAHSIKSADSKLSKAVWQIQTKRRIALTGSPMANHLLEYFRLLDWVAPSYLDTDFRETCKTHIELGLNEDSTDSERKRSLKFLRLLELETAAKVQRAGFKDLQDADSRLPPKTEFVITVPLSELQETSYRTFVRSIESGVGDVGSVQIWKYMTNLLLICNHPWSFHAHRTMLDESDRQTIQNTAARSSFSKSANKRPETRSTSLDALAPNRSLGQSGLAEDAQLDDGSTEQDGSSNVATAMATALPANVVQEQLMLLEERKDLDSPQYSYKMLVVLAIIQEARKAGDKTLVFSQGLQSLEYLANQLRKQSINWFLMTGATPMAVRNADVKNFNDKNHASSVFLISTMAGGLGLNLQGANRVIILDAKWNPFNEEQAIGRAYRMGQQKKVYVYRMIAGGTIETRLMKQGIFKLNMAARVVDKENPDRNSKRKYEYLFEPEAVPQSSLEEYVDRDPQVLRHLIRNPTCAAWIRKIELADSFSKPDDEVLSKKEQEEVDAMQKQMEVYRENPDKKLNFNWGSFGIPRQPAPAPTMMPLGHLLQTGSSNGPVPQPGAYIPVPARFILPTNGHVPQPNQYPAGLPPMVPQLVWTSPIMPPPAGYGPLPSHPSNPYRLDGSISAPLAGPAQLLSAVAAPPPETPGAEAITAEVKTAEGDCEEEEKHAALLNATMESGGESDTGTEGPFW